jgi:protein SCO1/2
MIMVRAFILSTAVLACASSFCSSMAFAANGDGSEKGAVPPQLQGIGITDRLGAQVSIQDLKFQDETGADVTLSKYFSTKKPVLLAVVYYACPSF